VKDLQEDLGFDKKLAEWRTTEEAKSAAAGKQQ
jgi:hypothetical protein